MVFDSRDNAKDVLLNSTLQANTGAVSGFDKSDFYKFQVNGSSSAFISLNALSADANVILSTASGQQLAASTLTGRTSEAISANLTAGTYYIQVVQNSGNTTYNLSLSSNNIFANIGDGDTNYIRGSSIKSYNNNRLDFQADGNLVVYNSQGRALWATGTYGTTVDRFAVQADGNMVLYAGNRAVWASDTAGNPGSRLAVQDDGNVVVYRANGQAAFNTGTWGGNTSTFAASSEWLKRWGGPSLSSFTIPTIPVNQFRAEYFNNNSLSGQAAFTQIESTVNKDWFMGGPGNGIGTDNFSVRWTGKFTFDGGDYNFSTGVDDGMKIWVDGSLVHNTWAGRSAIDRIENISIAAGEHEIKVEYREDGGAAMARVGWEKAPVIPTGKFRAEYFNNNSLSGQVAFTQIEDTVNKNWGLGGPGNGVGNDNFSVRWTGKFNFEGGNYNFSTGVDDGMKIWVDGSLVHNTWAGRSAIDRIDGIAIAAGVHEIKVEYREDLGAAMARIGWEKVKNDNNIYTNSSDVNYARGSSIKSSNNNRLDFQDDGNLVVYNSQGRALWATGTSGTTVDRFAVQVDGNMVLYTGSKAVWASDTSGNPGDRLSVQDDGNVVVYRANGQAAFNTGTWGGNTSTFAASSEWLKRYEASPTGSTGNPFQDAINRVGGQSVVGTDWNNGVHTWGSAQVQDFRNGDVLGILMKADGTNTAYWVSGDFLKTYYESRQLLGNPISDRYPSQGGWRQDFEGGPITKDAQGRMMVSPTIAAINAQPKLLPPTKTPEMALPNKPITPPVTTPPNVTEIYLPGDPRNSKPPVTTPPNITEIYLPGDPRNSKPPVTTPPNVTEIYLPGDPRNSKPPVTTLPNGNTPLVTPSVTSGSSSSASSKVDNFINRFNGADNITRLDRNDLRGECVTLIARYLQEEYFSADQKNQTLVLGNGRDTASVVGRNFSQFFKPVSDPADPVKGSIISFPDLGIILEDGTRSGHVAIVTDVRTINGQLQVKILDSNGASGRIVKQGSSWITITNGNGVSSGYGSSISWVNPRDGIVTVQPPVNNNGAASQASDAGLKFIGKWEGLETKLYNDAAGHATIGYGHLVHYGAVNGSEASEFRNGISQQRALELLRSDANDAAQAVRELVKVSLTQNQFDALTSFTFNLGRGNLQTSDLLARLNAGDYASVPSELNRWASAGGKRLDGLVNRRNEEGAMFRDGTYV